MKDFLKEFWLWILIPGVVVAAGILWLLMQDGDASSPFTYNLF